MKRGLLNWIRKSTLPALVLGSVLAITSPVSLMAQGRGGGHGGGHSGGAHAYSGGHGGGRSFGGGGGRSYQGGGGRSYQGGGGRSFGGGGRSLRRSTARLRRGCAKFRWTELWVWRGARLSRRTRLRPGPVLSRRRLVRRILWRTRVRLFLRSLRLRSGGLLRSCWKLASLPGLLRVSPAVLTEQLAFSRLNPLESPEGRGFSPDAGYIFTESMCTESLVILPVTVTLRPS